jgi:hypothetical protein
MVPHRLTCPAWLEIPLAAMEPIFLPAEGDGAAGRTQL